MCVGGVVTVETARERWAGLWGAGEQTDLMERVPPHVPAGQRLVEGEHHRVVLGVGLVAPLSDPALVVCQRVVEAPGSAPTEISKERIREEETGPTPEARQELAC